MTKLNPDQLALLAAVAELKVELDDDLAKLKEEYLELVEAAKSDLKVAVGNAAAVGVPDRRIGMALGTSDHKTIKSYYPEVDDASTD